jgi:hypothetical protein
MCRYLRSRACLAGSIEYDRRFDEAVSHAAPGGSARRFASPGASAPASPRGSALVGSDPDGVRRRGLVGGAERIVRKRCRLRRQDRRARVPGPDRPALGPLRPAYRVGRARPWLCGDRRRSGPSTALPAGGPAGRSAAGRLYVDPLPGLCRPRTRPHAGRPGRGGKRPAHPGQWARFDDWTAHRHEPHGALQRTATSMDIAMVSREIPSSCIQAGTSA